MSEKNDSIKTNSVKESPNDIRHGENSYRPPKPNKETKS